MSKIYLEKFIFPSMEDDNVSPIEHLGPFYDENCYPYHIMSEMGLFRLDFEFIRREWIWQIRLNF